MSPRTWSCRARPPMNSWSCHRHPAPPSSAPAARTSSAAHPPTTVPFHPPPAASRPTAMARQRMQMMRKDIVGAERDVVTWEIGWNVSPSWDGRNRLLVSMGNLLCRSPRSEMTPSIGIRVLASRDTPGIGPIFRQTAALFIRSPGQAGVDPTGWIKPVSFPREPIVVGKGLGQGTRTRSRSQKKGYGPLLC